MSAAIDARPAALPFEFKGVVRVTRPGAVYLLATMILAVSAVNTGNNALYIAVSLMLGCMLLSGLASKGGLKHLEVELGGHGDVWAGREVAGTIRVRNRSRIWSVRDVVLTSGAFARPVLLPLLERRSEITTTAPLLFARRGWAQVSVIDSYTRYPFGFFLKKRRLRVASDVLVFPRLLPESDAEARFRAIAGDADLSGRPGPGTDVHSFREYVRGDSLRQVHWKRSASLGRWIVKQPEAEMAPAVHVVVDPYKSRETTEQDFERMISEAATFIVQTLERGLEVTLVLPRAILRTRDADGATGLYRALALLEPLYEPVHLLAERDAVVFSARTEKTR